MTGKQPLLTKACEGIRRLFWRAVLCEPEERAELTYGYATTSSVGGAEFKRRKARYEFTFGPLP